MSLYDKTRSELAYAERGMSKLRKELSSTTLITRQKALVTMSDLMHSTERVHEAVRVGCLQQIVTLLHDGDETIRYKAVSVLQNMLKHTVGREAFVTKNDGLSNLTELFNDDSVKIQLKTFEVIETLSTVRMYAQKIVDAGLLPIFVKDHLSNIGQVTAEKLQVVLVVLEIVQRLLFMPISAAGDNHELIAKLQSDNLSALDAFNKLTKHDNSDIRTNACLALHDLCVNCHLAKDQASRDKNIIKQLTYLLNDKEKSVRVASCKALMTICITTAGKLAAFEEDVVSKLLYLIDEAIEVSESKYLDTVTIEEDSENDALRLYAIRAVEVMAEVPDARLIFAEKDNVGKLKNLEENFRLSSDVRRAATETISVIQWKP